MSPTIWKLNIAAAHYKRTGQITSRKSFPIFIPGKTWFLAQYLCALARRQAPSPLEYVYSVSVLEMFAKENGQ